MINVSPGRFFAVYQLKLVLAFILLRYNIRTNEKPELESQYFLFQRVPRLNAEISFQDRARSEDE